MSDGQILVNFGALQDASGQVRSAAGSIQSQLDDLKAGVQRIAASWTGAAQQGYQGRQQQWDSSATDLHHVLLKIADVIQQAHDASQATERQNANIWG